MSKQKVGMPARYYHKGTIRASSVEGVLRMTQERFVFTPYIPTECARVNECFDQIACQKFMSNKPNQPLLNLTNKEGQMYIFGFGRYSQRDVCRQFAGKVLRGLKAMQSSRQDTKVSETPAVTIHDVQMTAEEKERPNNLPLENNQLLIQHEQFVTNGMLTEADDWATRKVKGIVDETKEAITTISTRKREKRTKEEEMSSHVSN